MSTPASGRVAAMVEGRRAETERHRQRVLAAIGAARAEREAITVAGIARRAGIDRASRINLIGDLPAGYDVTRVLACCIELLERVPEELRRTLTWDQETDMARHGDLASAVGIDVFFADPHRPWLPRTNDSFNGLLRRYVGKSTNLSVYSQQDRDLISHRINTMPRRIFKWESRARPLHCRGRCVDRSNSPPKLTGNYLFRAQLDRPTPFAGSRAR